jgi:hypothetical protein
MGRRKKPVVADVDEPIRQPMLPQAAAERLGGDRGVAELTGFGFVRAAWDLTGFELHDAVSADRPSTAGGGHRPPCCLSATDRLTVHHPVSFPHRWIDKRAPLSLWSVLPELGPEAPREGRNMPQAGFP